MVNIYVGRYMYIYQVINHMTLTIIIGFNNTPSCFPFIFQGWGRVREFQDFMLLGNLEKS